MSSRPKACWSSRPSVTDLARSTSPAHVPNAGIPASRRSGSGARAPRSRAGARSPSTRPPAAPSRRRLEVGRGAHRHARDRGPTARRCSRTSPWRATSSSAAAHLQSSVSPARRCARPLTSSRSTRSSFGRRVHRHLAPLVHLGAARPADRASARRHARAWGPARSQCSSRRGSSTAETTSPRSACWTSRCAATATGARSRRSSRRAARRGRHGAHRTSVRAPRILHGGRRRRGPGHDRRR